MYCSVDVKHQLTIFARLLLVFCRFNVQYLSVRLNFFLNIILLNFIAVKFIFQISYSDGIDIKWRANSNPIIWKGNLVSFDKDFFCFLNWVSFCLSSTRFYKKRMANPIIWEWTCLNMPKNALSKLNLNVYCLQYLLTAFTELSILNVGKHQWKQKAELIDFKQACLKMVSFNHIQISFNLWDLLHRLIFCLSFVDKNKHQWKEQACIRFKLCSRTRVY